MKYDLIIVAKSGRKEVDMITQNCIDSAFKYLDGQKLNVILVETSGKRYPFIGVNKYVDYQGVEFNYNHALNLGVTAAIGDVFILANNDIVFTKGWAQIGDLMKYNKFDSASALSEDKRQRYFNRGNWIYEGYDIGRHVTGWCLFLTANGYKKIGQLDETFNFWYSDNVYSDQIRAAGLRHGLFCNIQINHVTSATLRTLPQRIQFNYSHALTHKYYKWRALYAKGKGNK